MRPAYRIFLSSFNKPALSVSVLLFSWSCQTTEPRQDASAYLVDGIAIAVTEGSREVAYTNKDAGFFYTESNGELRNGWQGWTVAARKMLDDYLLSVDGRPLRRSGDVSAVVYPHQLVRQYEDGVREAVTLLDSINALSVEIQGVEGSSVRLTPLFSDATRQSSFQVTYGDHLLLIARKNHLSRTKKENFPVWVCVAGDEDLAVRTDEFSVGSLFSPANAETPVRDKRARFFLLVGDTENEVIALAQKLRLESDRLVAAKKERLERLLRSSFVQTDDERLNRALMWAKISLDALVMNQSGKGIFAGLPWFNDYWSRDTFISLPGAALVTGKYNEAREIFLSFSRLQEMDPQSSNYGRIPNRVTMESVSYNTADGTPWFVRELYEYIKYSNDTLLARQLYPVVKRSIEGTLRYHVDHLYFLTHGDAETWMDAAGPEGPWSPRGNRAAEVQVLWYYQLLVGSFMASFVGDLKSAERWGVLADSVNAHFNEKFIDPVKGEVYDHLSSDGTASREVRPNQIFCLDMINSEAVRQKVVKTIVSQLTYPYGVASLSQEDENFHPYHHYEPYYAPDAAYHNGVVWTWLAGQVIYGMTRNDLQDMAFKLTSNMVDLILDRGAVGTLSELVDAVPRPGEVQPRLSGTFSQAWSLAEFIRSFYQDYLGALPDATGNILVLSPRLPTSVKEVQFVQRVENATVTVQYAASGGHVRATLASDDLDRDLKILLFWTMANGDAWRVSAALKPGKTLRFVLDSNEFTVYEDDQELNLKPLFLRGYSLRGQFSRLTFAEPVIREGLRSVKGPAHALLHLDQVRQSNDNAKIIFSAIDEQGDDRGDGDYAYPTNSHFADGILDIARFLVTADDRNVYFNMQFRNLVNPGWHPEYGFQLTYVAIAIDKDRTRNSGKRSVGANSGYTLDPRYAYETLLCVGGGFRVVDASGRTTAEYYPAEADTRNPIGDAALRTVSFSIPVEFIGIPDENWRFTVLVGAQDDHGGAGIGEFRSVERAPDEWVGGGRRLTSQSNVYDTIMPR